MQRDFTASHPNQLWVADLTYLRCLEGVVYFAFVLDCFSRMVVGRQLAAHMRTDLVLDALEMANGLRQPEAGLIAHTDNGSLPGLNRSSQRCVGDMIVGARRAPRRGFSSRVSFGAGCSAR